VPSHCGPLLVSRLDECEWPTLTTPGATGRKGEEFYVCHFTQSAGRVGAKVHAVFCRWTSARGPGEPGVELSSASALGCIKFGVGTADSQHLPVQEPRQRVARDFLQATCK